MKTLISFIVALSLMATAALATDLARVPGSVFSSPSAPNAIQMFSPDGTKTTTLTVASTTVNLSNYIMFELESGSGTTCNVRSMATATKANQVTVFRVAGTRRTFAVNQNTPFVNFSGCTAGSYMIQ
jgi:hypothetical protein